MNRSIPNVINDELFHSIDPRILQIINTSCFVLCEEWPKFMATYKYFMNNTSSFAVCSDWPMSLAAMEAPTMMDRLGAMKDIRDSTYSKILALHSVRSTACNKQTNNNPHKQNILVTWFSLLNLYVILMIDQIVSLTSVIHRLPSTYTWLIFYRNLRLTILHASLTTASSSGVSSDLQDEESFQHSRSCLISIRKTNSQYKNCLWGLFQFLSCKWWCFTVTVFKQADAKWKIFKNKFGSWKRNTLNLKHNFCPKWAPYFCL